MLLDLTCAGLLWLKQQVDFCKTSRNSNGSKVEIFYHKRSTPWTSGVVVQTSCFGDLSWSN